MTMPGLPKVPAAEKIDVDETGKITGLSDFTCQPGFRVNMDLARCSQKSTPGRPKLPGRFLHTSKVYPLKIK